MRLTPGGVRELHWHQQAEWAFMILGRARVTSVDQNGRNFIADVSLNQWMALTPYPLVANNLHVGPELMGALRKQKWPVVKYP